MGTTVLRTYSDLILLPTFEERLNYLRLGSSVGMDTFGYDRYMNQQFYRSEEWKQLRKWVIVRDNGCDLGMPGYSLSKIYIHHMNPITPDDIIHSTEFLMNPEYLISVSHQTHNAIHYGTESDLPPAIVERTPYDTCPWRQENG